MKGRLEEANLGVVLWTLIRSKAAGWVVAFMSSFMTLFL